MEELKEKIIDYLDNTQYIYENYSILEEMATDIIDLMEDDSEKISPVDWLG